MSTIATRPATGGARFVAYDRNVVRIGNPEDGSAISVRAETWVEEYATIRVAQYQEKSSGGFDTVYIQFDAASTGAPGMTHNFGASTEAGGAVAARLKHACDTQTPVYVAIETRRRKHVEGKKDQPIDVLTPIHTLRGAAGESLSGQPQATKANCAKVIVVVGGVEDLDDTAVASEKELRSDLTEWPLLRGNKLGDLPPEGWRCMVRDGKRTGGITQAPVNSASTDTAALATAVAEQLAAQFGTSANQPGRVASKPAGVRRAVAAEGKPWEPLNSDGRPNAGSDLAAKIRATHESAIYLLTGALEAAAEDELPEMTAEQSLDHVWKLTDILLWIGDKTQEHVVGRANRLDRSHKEAGMWVMQVINTRFPYSVEHIANEEACRKWAMEVLNAARDDFMQTYQRMAKFLEVDLTTTTDAKGAAPVAASAAPQQLEQSTATEARPQSVDQGIAQREPGVAETHSQSAQQSRPQQQNLNQGRPQNAGEVAASVDAWKALAASVEMTEHIDQLRFILKATFGVPRGMLGEIEASAFNQQVAKWATNPAAFRQAAEQAFVADPENRQQKAS